MSLSTKRCGNSPHQQNDRKIRVVQRSSRRERTSLVRPRTCRRSTSTRRSPFCSWCGTWDVLLRSRISTFRSSSRFRFHLWKKKVDQLTLPARIVCCINKISIYPDPKLISSTTISCIWTFSFGNSKYPVTFNE